MRDIWCQRDHDRAESLPSVESEDATPNVSKKTGLPAEIVIGDAGCQTLYLKVRRASSSSSSKIVRIDGKRYERSLGGYPR